MDSLLAFLENNATAIAALMVSIVSVWFTWKTLHYQREHNYRSVRPIGNIDVGDYEDNIYVSIVNNGMGPLIIQSVTVKYGSLSANNLIDVIPDSLSNDIPWRDFFSELANTAIPAGEQITLIEWDEENYDEQVFMEDVEDHREELRGILSQVTISLVYTDIYENQQPVLNKTLTWFGRDN